MLTNSPPAARLLDAFETVRARTEALAAPLSPEDQCVQTMPDVSPTKWHRAHTTWFWETFLLGEFNKDYKPFDPDFCYLFNSYYEQVGERHPRAERGQITRPSCSDVAAYRVYVDAAVRNFLSNAPDDLISAVTPIIELGVGHEEQHQELLLTDIKHVLSRNPLSPAAYPAPDSAPRENPDLTFTAVDGGLVETGHADDGFAYDNESPRHKVWLEPFALADRPVTNGDWLDFVQAGGYRTATLWLSDGWATVQADEWRAPLHWRERDGVWREFTLHGETDLDPAAPVCHISFYEAQAYAEWAGLRLPTEHEWEHAAAEKAGLDGRFMDAGQSAHPGPVPGGKSLAQMFGGVWEWTRSDYAPYPGFRTPDGAVGEYNGKFMCGQYVLRGGSCATPPGHVRRTYRNFFPPDARWQFSGVRMARDA
ncbi:ergothioneine biosynthesis protein EgtB [Hyphobacterium marinum]|uniref:Ergothioneine biosynthesis protein EgtB n=1 Tax=Hyphobacterium marinum TaxID=3116574 RepID=A0ABU7M1T0_9PROT|nr:ergothioneine biosynthesis protein EgtB [Hyphobacterium sp. Y6023]MEE2567733.1 ergothioneine biosynthesis protein EgtB [Hyphobacterium sp. Y6023]